MLDLRFLLLADTPLLVCQTRQAALAAGRPRGWSRADCRQAYNRFGRFGLLGQWVEVGITLRCAAITPGYTVLLTLKSPAPAD